MLIDNRFFSKFHYCKLTFVRSSSIYLKKKKLRRKKKLNNSSAKSFNTPNETKRK